MENTETKRCRNIRRVIIALFVVCGYMLSTTFAGAYLPVEGEQTFVTMTALNFAFGAMGSDNPVLRNTPLGILYCIIPLVGFFFMFFDKKSNLKNYVGIVCGAVGCLSIAFPLAANSSELAIGIGAIVSILCYMIITMLSGISVFMKLEDRRNGNTEPKRLSKHEE